MVAVSLLVTVCTIFEMKGRKNNLKIWSLWNLKQATKRLMKDSILSKCHLKSWTYFQNPSLVTVYTRTSVCIVSMLCSIHYLWCWKGEFFNNQSLPFPFLSCSIVWLKVIFQREITWLSLLGSKAHALRRTQACKIITKKKRSQWPVLSLTTITDPQVTFKRYSIYAKTLNK